MPMARSHEHFLFVTDPMQSHINPARRLAVRVAAVMPNARVTFSTAVSGHRQMFPQLTSPDGEVVQGVVSYIPYSDGFDAGFNPEAQGVGAYRERARAVGSETLAAVVARLAKRGHPVTRLVYTAIVGWVPDVARAHGVPVALYWVKPATVFTVYYHYFHGHGEVLASCASDHAVVRLPGLPPLKAKDLPSFASMASPGSRNYLTLDMLRDIFVALDEHRPTVLVDTFDALEPEALRAVPPFNLVAVGPVVVDEPCRPCVELFQPSDAKAYLDWLDTKPARSVVFVSFGSVLSLSKRQDEELRRGLEATGRPYLLWARKSNNSGAGDGDSGRGTVVEWCNQTKVLSHHAVGCFVTHCRWDSTLESITGGVPMVAVPRWADQPTVAALVEASAGVGVRACLDADGVLERGELQRCVEMVMGSTDGAAAVRARAERWGQRAKEAAAMGGTSQRSLRAFASGL
ncbi:Crocetin glucosyltransferase, chloroplastic [Dichanthelium oligosanthes]|uniref:Crocetin glucosyltransferase, chloroplastic n=1 Tax=Dichanthelium oligosanthes TaxID=888268 RepID=A0A1E5UT29_9POAL|nr:Crocetin glucosyltransferase, chloroplastic [Dichanthelium oligosanthes]